MSAQTIKVEVAYALPQKQAILEVEVPDGSSALEAARLSGIVDRFEGLDLDDAKLGIFGKVVSPAQVLSDGDRVEIYRPLVADPKEVRKARAARARERREQGEA
ncbi:MAG: RnfH family protein [Halioglobus sp.]|nr:RnfH family protein [Halioglobus sp.]